MLKNHAISTKTREWNPLKLGLCFPFEIAWWSIFLIICIVHIASSSPKRMKHGNNKVEDSRFQEEKCFSATRPFPLCRTSFHILRLQVDLKKKHYTTYYEITQWMAFLEHRTTVYTWVRYLSFLNHIFTKLT